MIDPLEIAAKLNQESDRLNGGVTYSTAKKAVSAIHAQAEEIRRLQRIIDSRPAINAGLPETYIEWSRGIYQCDVNQVIGHDA